MKSANEPEEFHVKWSLHVETTVVCAVIDMIYYTLKTDVINAIKAADDVPQCAVYVQKARSVSTL